MRDRADIDRDLTIYRAMLHRDKQADPDSPDVARDLDMIDLLLDERGTDAEREREKA